MTNFLSSFNAIVWGAPALILILGVGVYFTVRLGFVQLVLLLFYFFLLSFCFLKLCKEVILRLCRF